jgi:outer membrane protein OmpA-like peptidoglycan-associated protein
MNRIFVALLLSAALAVPGLSQQSNSNSSMPAADSGQSSPASQTAISPDPIPAPTSTDFWDGDDPNLVNLVTHPFANKKYVQRMTRPIKDRLEELDQISSSNRTAIHDIDSRAQQGLQLASEKTNLADQHASDAATKAQSAQSAASQASTRVGSVEQRVGSLDQYKGATQTEIRFRPGQSALSKEAKDAIDGIAAPLKDEHSYIIEVRGFSSGSGQSAIANSQKMADSVVRYLVLSHNIPMYRIYVLSMGNVPEAMGAKRVSGGRVEINLLKNDATSAQQ